ncbi:MAG: hypothetical protein HY306_05535 [Nitrosomonadales bacterium]|nr:hypothetical protein [Nitrosomonadales bacterium]
MKYNSKNKMLTFSSDEEVVGFHDQLTDVMRSVMLNIGNGKANSKEEDLKLTQEFFERYAALAETLSCLRAHLPRKTDG